MSTTDAEVPSSLCRSDNGCQTGRVPDIEGPVAQRRAQLPQPATFEPMNGTDSAADEAAARPKPSSQDGENDEVRGFHHGITGSSAPR